MAHARAGERTCRPRESKLADNPLCAGIEELIGGGWSPKLIAEMLARDHPDDKLARVRRETIYQCLYVQIRGSLRADLHKCVSTKRAARKRRGSDNPIVAPLRLSARCRAVDRHPRTDLVQGNLIEQNLVGGQGSTATPTHRASLPKSGSSESSPHSVGSSCAAEVAPSALHQLIAVAAIRVLGGIEAGPLAAIPEREVPAGEGEFARGAAAPRRYPRGKTPGASGMPDRVGAFSIDE